VDLSSVSGIRKVEGGINIDRVVDNAVVLFFFLLFYFSFSVSFRTAITAPNLLYVPVRCPNPPLL